LTTLAFQLELARPGALLFLVLIPVIYLIARRTLVDLPLWQRRASLAVRALAILLIALALAGLTLLSSTQKQFTLFLLDQSQSIDASAAKKAQDFITQSSSSPNASGGGNKTLILPFAQSPGTPYTPGTPIPSATSSTSGGGTNIALALDAAAASIPPSYVPHIVLLSDGNQTTGDALARAASLGLRISSVPLPVSANPEVQVRSVTAPSDVRRGEPFFLDVTVDATQKSQGRIQVFRGPLKVADDALTLEPGENKLRLKQTVADEKSAQFSVRILGFPDTLADNNQAQAIVLAAGKPRVLLIESDIKSAKMLDSALKEQDIQLEARPPQGMPDSLTDLANFDVLILSNVPATSFTTQQMETVRTYVQDLGGGLIMIGGDQSFGLGGYYKTPIEQALPVRSDFEQQNEKPGLAMLMVIDRSGSMGGQKMEMAKEAAKAAVELLGPKDQVGIIAFDSQPHWIVDLRGASDKAYIEARIASIKPSGGTSIAPGMALAKDALQNTPARLKHVIILTDGMSAPGDFDGLATRMAELKITISCVAVGQDADANLLTRIAKTGNGRFYQANDPSNIPQIFARETITASKGAITEEPFLPQVVRPTPVLAGVGLDTAPFLLGYVRTRAKPTSQLILTTEQGDPLLAWWRYGLGMSVAFTSDAKPKWAAEWASWPGYSRFWAQLVRHAMRRAASENLSMQLKESDGTAHVAVDALADNSAFLSTGAVSLRLVSPDLSSQEIPLPQTGPGRFEASFPASTPGAYHLEVTQTHPGKEPARLSRPLVIGYPDELRLKPTNEPLLRSLAQTTSGLYNPTPAEVFTTPPNASAQDAVPLWPFLTAAAILLFILDVALRRLDMSLYFPSSSPSDRPYLTRRQS
jgi:Ca-activated chloride channel homolog